MKFKHYQGFDLEWISQLVPRRLMVNADIAKVLRQRRDMIGR